MVKQIKLDGVIGTGKDEISSKWFESQLPTDNSEIEVRIHSEGGSVVEGFRIYDLAHAYSGPKKAIIESAAYSIASFIPMAFDEVEIAPNGYMMLHNPYMGAEGDDEALSAKAEFLKKLKTNMVEAYAARSGKSDEEVLAILKKESFLNATEVVANGFADRITSKPVIGRVFAQLDSMPHGVVTALFGAGSGGNNEPPSKDKPMSDSKPVAATVDEIEKQFPKASADFVLRCIKKQMPLASVASAAAEEMLKENEELKAKIKAMEDEQAEAKAKAEEEEQEATAKAAEEETVKEAEAKARRVGVSPVGMATGGVGTGATAKARWSEAVQAKVNTGMSRDLAAVAVDQENPSLRAAVIAEANSAR